jgi:hypothetical protein
MAHSPGKESKRNANTLSNITDDSHKQYKKLKIQVQKIIYFMIL